MKFTEIYKESIKYWPKSIDASDGEIKSNGGIHFVKLSQIYDEIENKINHDNAWVELMTWCIFKYVHQQALKGHSKTINVNSFDLKELEKIYFRDMNESTTGYQSLKSDYINDLSRKRGHAH